MRRSLNVLSAIVCLLAAPLLVAQESETVTIVAGEGYEAGGLQRFLFGQGYRELWGMSIDVRVLDLDAEGGGLEPVMAVGGLQTRGLAMRGADGKSYTFRGVHKDLIQILPEELRDTPIAEVAQDLLTASVPASGLAANPLAVAAGVLQPIPKLVVMPDSPILGEFREEFAGVLGTFEEYPSAATGGGTFGALEIVDGDEIFPWITESPDNAVDSREFLRARLVDMLMGDWDRHVGQWRFARIADRPGLVSISEDRDQAFAQYEGWTLRMARDREPKFGDFGPEYSGFEGLNWNARSLDRRLLSGLSRTAWIEIAEDIQRRLTDEAIRDAIGRMPPEYFEAVGESLIADLLVRRDNLVEVAEGHYEFLSGEVNVFATDVAELFEVERMAAGSVRVSIARIREQGAGCEVNAADPPHFQRVFRPNETKEVRVFTGNGNDRVRVAGPDISGPKVRVIGGAGDNLLCDIEAETTFAFDMSSADDAGSGHRVRDAIWVAPSESIADAGTPATSQGPALTARRDWGSTSYRLPVFGYGPDVGPLVGYGVVFERYGFRKRPYSVQHQIRAAAAFGAVSGRLDYAGIYRRENSRQFWIVRGLASGIESLRYYGLGNDTEEAGDADFYRIRQTQLAAEGRAAFWAGESATLTAGAIVRWTRTQEERDEFIAFDRPYGIEDTFQAGVVAGFNFNNRRHPTERELKGSDDALRFGPSPLGVGYTFDANAHYYPETGGLRSDYGFVNASATASYLLGRRGPAVSFRIGGAETWGDVPYYDAAYLGSDELRGLRPNRYAGNRSVYGNAAAFFHVGRLNLLAPGRWGVLARGGAGRVWIDDDVSDTWHTSFGGGLWWAPWDIQTAVRLEVSKSDESTLFYLLLGFGF
ncbi:MAG: hypothetical protein GKS06_03355 [Acidobacteria bacterium]|nr:hypothetical protein [Acidobacteriota bacterium]